MNESETKTFRDLAGFLNEEARKKYRESQDAKLEADTYEQASRLVRETLHKMGIDA